MMHVLWIVRLMSPCLIFEGVLLARESLFKTFQKLVLGPTSQGATLQNVFSHSISLDAIGLMKKITYWRESQEQNNIWFLSSSVYAVLSILSQRYPLNDTAYVSIDLIQNQHEYVPCFGVAGRMMAVYQDWAVLIMSSTYKDFLSQYSDSKVS